MPVGPVSQPLLCMLLGSQSSIQDAARPTSSVLGATLTRNPVRNATGLVVFSYDNAGHTRSAQDGSGASSIVKITLGQQARSRCHQVLKYSTGLPLANKLSVGPHEQFRIILGQQAHFKTPQGLKHSPGLSWAKKLASRCHWGLKQSSGLS